MPLKDKIEAYLAQGLKGSKIITLLKREGIDVSIDGSCVLLLYRLSPISF